MRADAQPTSSRLGPTVSRWRWLWSAGADRRGTKAEELEVIERLDRLEREARRSGAYVPTLGVERRWS